MGKRSDFKRRARDYYRTPQKAVEPLILHLNGKTFAEPMAGDGALVSSLEALSNLKCTWQSDIEPQTDWIIKYDAFNLTINDYGLDTDYIITNPPWSRPILHRCIEIFANIKPTWLLIDTDWVHTKQAIPYLPNLHKCVSIGRVKWFDNIHGKDDCAWYLFDNSKQSEFCKLYGRL
tara:strand:+ start:966 stop:1493 length:528 start_codon:yes stop_codon:yes gene_type:complete